MNYTLNKSLLFALLVFGCSSYSLSQVVVRGIVHDSDGKAVPNINILIYPPGHNALIAFAVSNQNGVFEATIRHDSDSLDIEASSVQYRNQRLRFPNQSQQIQFVLETEITQLDAFTIKAPPLEKRGDTLSYLVSAFSRPQDRAIIDVINRLPGVEVIGGRILYQGEPLISFYVEGMDLMAGRYGLITQNLPSKSVAAIEILENHQPLKILEDRVVSYRAAMNIKLKRTVTTTGTANLGSGFAPLLWDANATPMMFTSGFQVLGSYQANNTGKDLGEQVVMNTASSIGRLGSIGRMASRPPGFLAVESMQNPAFALSRVLNNNQHLGSANGLIKLARDYQLRVNLSYLNDRNYKEGNVYRTFYTHSDTLHFTDSRFSENKDSGLEAEITITRNVKERFLENKLNVRRRWDSSMGISQQSAIDISQDLSSPFEQFGNQLRALQFIGNRLVEFVSEISYDKHPQSLLVSPVPSIGIFADYADAEHIRQELSISRFSANHNAMMRFSFRKVDLRQTFGLYYQSQHLVSELHLMAADQLQSPEEDFVNNMTASQIQAYSRSELTYRTSSLSLVASLPISIRLIKIEDHLASNTQNIRKLYPEPRLSMNYYLTSKWILNSSIRYANSFPGFDGMYYGYIMTNHRSVQKRPVPLPENRLASFEITGRYNNPFTLTNASLSYVFSSFSRSQMMDLQVLSNGATLSTIIEKPYSSNSHIVSLQAGSKIMPLASDIGMKVTYNYSGSPVLVNGTENFSVNHVMAIDPMITTDFATWINTSYRPTFLFFANRFGNDGNYRKQSSQKHPVGIHVFPAKNHYVSLTYEYYKYRGYSASFLDLSYRISFPKKRTDLQIGWNNILQANEYTEVSISPYLMTVTTIMLRPSQIWFTYKFSF